MKCKRSIIFTVCFLLVLASLSFFVGFYLYKKSKPQVIFERNADLLIDSINHYLQPGDDFFVGDNFTIDSTINFSLDSEYYSRQSTLEDIKKYNLIQNLNQADTHLLLKQSKERQSLFGHFYQSIGSEKLVDDKLLIDNATEYYFVNQFIGYYINNGSCNYFEALNGNNTTKSNIEYLYNFILNSLKLNIMKEKFTAAETKASIYGRKQRVHQVTIEFSDSTIHSILNGVLNDLKRDEQSYFILKNVYRDFPKYKIKKAVHFLDDNEVYALNIYTSRFFYRPLKYEFIHIKKEQKQVLSCEINKSSVDIFYYENNKYSYHITLLFHSDDIILNIFNSKNKKLGESHFENDKNNVTFNLSFDNGKLKYDFIYSSKMLGLKKNKSYDYEQKLSFKIIDDKVVLLNGNILIDSKISNKAKIVEDVSSAKLSSKLSDEEKSILKLRKETIIKRLERR